MPRAVCSAAVVVLVLLAAGCGDDSEPAGPRDATVDDDGAGPTDAGPSCDPGLTLCGDRCVDTSSTDAHCGGCDNACGTGQSCSGGECVCIGELEACGSECVDTTSNVEHCGACGNACESGSVCASGSCSTEGCPDGTTDCGGSCVDTDTSESHCGSCDNACGSSRTCESGTCTCTEGLTDCGGVCVDTSTDADHCGECGNACGTDRTCSSGTCTCADGLTECSGSCVDTSTNSDHCGECGNSCESGAGCSGGSCVSCGPESTLSGHVQPIFTEKCAVMGCHAGTRPSANLSLEAGESHGDLVGVPSNGCSGSRTRVVAGSPGESYLMDKLLGTDICEGEQMPRRETMLPSSELELIESWICRGAKND